MSTKDRASNTVRNVTGATKEVAGKVTGDRSLEAEGKGDQVIASAKKLVLDVVDDVKEAVTSVRDTAKR